MTTRKFKITHMAHIGSLSIISVLLMAALGGVCQAQRGETLPLLGWGVVLSLSGDCISNTT